MPDGSLDPSFDPNANGVIERLVVQPDGKILIGGAFTEVDGTTRNRIARLMPDGLLDLSFDPGTGADISLRTVIVLPDGKILIGGSFTQFNGTPRNKIARLMLNGSLDLSFDPGAGINPGLIRTLAMQRDGKILIGGLFTSFNGTPHKIITRLILPSAAGSQVHVPILRVSMLAILIGLLGLFGRRYRHKTLKS